VRGGGEGRPRRRGALRQAGRAGFRRRRLARVDYVELERRARVAEGDDVAIGEMDVALDPLAVDEGAVLAAQVLEDKPVGGACDRGVPRRDVEVALGVEADVRQGMASDADVRFGGDFDLAGARAREELELRLQRARALRAGTGALLPL
jgi:hypothetical protein